MDYRIIVVILTIYMGKCLAEGECNHSCLPTAECAYIRKNNVCYYLFDRNSLNWEGNEKFCVDKGMKMVQTSGRNVGIVSKLRYNSTNFNYDGVWLGGEAVNFEKWTFLNSTDVGKITGLILQAPMKFEDFGYMDTRDYTFSAGSCSTPRYFLCRYVGISNHSITKEFKNWFQARQHCIEDGGDLFYMKQGDNMSSISISIELELQKASVTRGSLLHIGMFHRIWQWLDGSPIMYTNWATGEPNKAHEQCLMMHNNGEWNDADCSSHKPAFCQTGLETTADLDVTTRPPTTKPTMETNSNLLTSTNPENTPESTTLGASSSISINVMSTTLESTANTDTSSDTSRYQNHQENVEQTKVTIILGVLLGVFILTYFMLIIYIVVVKQKRSSDDPDTISPYVEARAIDYSSSTPISDEGIHPNGVTRAIDNDYTVADAPSTSSAFSKKPLIKPKPVIGPLNGDVYARIGK